MKYPDQINIIERVIHDAPSVQGLSGNAKRFKTITAQEWRDDFFKLEAEYGYAFKSVTKEGWIVTAVSEKGVFHFRKGQVVLHAIPFEDMPIFLYS